jgi:hypothetical protein
MTEGDVDVRKNRTSKEVKELSRLLMKNWKTFSPEQVDDAQRRIDILLSGTAPGVIPDEGFVFDETGVPLDLLRELGFRVSDIDVDSSSRVSVTSAVVMDDLFDESVVI